MHSGSPPGALLGQPNTLADSSSRSGPYLIAQRTPHHSPLALWHLLSLDAPTVAAAWTWFVARCAHVSLPWSAPAAMFVAVWMIYAADRLLDARLLDSLPSPTQSNAAELEERHRFHHRHRVRFFCGVVVAACLLIGLLTHSNHRALELYVLLATLLGTWMLLIHARLNVGLQRLPKELAVGIFFPAATFIPTVARAPQLQVKLLPLAGLFAGVCALNCLFVYAWEHSPQACRRLHAHWTTRWAIRHLVELSASLFVLSVGTAAVTSLASGAALACAMSAVMLAALHSRHLCMKPVELRALADLVLLTPLVIVLAQISLRSVVR